jgi:uncharacterized protein (DUF58 family)
LLRRIIFRNFRYLYLADEWVRRRLGPGGKLLMAALVASAVFGVDTRQSHTYQVFAVLLTLLAVAVAERLFSRIPVEARRSLPQFATVGQAFSYRVKIRNAGRGKLSGLYLSEVFDYSLPTFDELFRAHEPGEERRNWFDRTVGYPRWLWLVARRRGAEVADQPLPPLGPTEEVTAEVRFLPLRRGYVRFRAIAIARTDPLGLVRSLVAVSHAQALLVLPRIYRVPRLRLPGSRHYQPGGVALVSSVGDSQEFFALRDYRPGDAWRHIHWRSWAKTGRPVVKEFREEFMVRYALVLDTFSGADDEAMFEEAVSVAASVASAPRQEDSLLELLFAGPTAYPVAAGRGVTPTEHLLEVLACVTPTRGRAFRELEELVRARATSLSACLCVLLGWDSARQSLVALLKSLGVHLRVLVLTRNDTPLEPGPMGDEPQHLHRLPAGRVAEALARL